MLNCRRWQMIAGEPLAACWRKVRTPYGDMPRKTRGHRSCKIAVTESVTEKTPPVLWQLWATVGEAVSFPRLGQARVKRRGKSSPLAEQFARQEKPHAVQDKTEGGQPARRSSGIVAPRCAQARRASRESGVR